MNLLAILAAAWVGLHADSPLYVFALCGLVILLAGRGLIRTLEATDPDR